MNEKVDSLADVIHHVEEIEKQLDRILQHAKEIKKDLETARTPLTEVMGPAQFVEEVPSSRTVA